MKKLYVLLTDTGTLLGRTIKWFTNAPNNHVSLVLDEYLDEMYSFGRIYARNPLIAGFIREDVYVGTYRYFAHTRCQLLSMEVSLEEYSCIKHLIKQFNENRNRYSYNLLGLVGVAMNHPIDQKNKYFCSQFVAEVLGKSGLELWELPPALITPSDFSMNPRFKLVYEGRLYDYPLLDHTKLSCTAVGLE